MATVFVINLKLEVRDKNISSEVIISLCESAVAKLLKHLVPR